MRSHTIGLPCQTFPAGIPLVFETFRRAPGSTITIISKTQASRDAIRALETCLQDGLSIHSSHNESIPIKGISAVADDCVGGPFLYCQSSGSSNNAKTIRRRPASWIRSFEVNRSRLGLTSKDGYAILGALSHSLTLYAMLEALHMGADVTILKGLQPKTQLSALTDQALSVIYATPSQLRLLLSGDKIRSRSLPNLRFILCGGGKLDEACRAGLSALCPNARIFEFYGASETSFITMADADTPQGSVGPAYPGVDMSIRDTAGCATEGVGEIWVKSDYLFDGYEIGDSADTRWQDGYLTVGEMGQLDGRGNLFLKGRKSRMVTVADQNIFLEDVEAALHQTPAVRSCAAFARADRQRGHVIVAVVEADEATDLTDFTECLKSSCRAQLGVLASPREIYYINHIPMLPAGKPDLIALTRWLEVQI